MILRAPSMVRNGRKSTFAPHGNGRCLWQGRLAEATISDVSASLLRYYQEQICTHPHPF
jgi:hypothetical protein